MSTPFDKASSSIPVTVVTTGAAAKYATPGDKLLHLEPEALARQGVFIPPQAAPPSVPSGVPKAIQT